MKAAIKEAKEIKRINDAMHATDSFYLQRDYNKAVLRKTRELREYCRLKGIDYKAVCAEAGI